EGHREYRDSGDDIQGECQMRPGNEHRPEGSQGMHLVRSRFQLRKQAAHMDEVVEVIPHYGRSVVEPSHRELCECGEQRAPHDHPFACPKDYKDGCKPELRLENQATQSES